SHADFANRLPRGRTYVRNGCVLDLKIARGEVRAKVFGTELYEAVVRLEPLSRERWAAVRAACAGRVATAVELLAGKVSSAVMAVLSDADRGIFPKPGELDLTCSCPDAAWLCKHLAAVLYGVGARLDEAPELLFTLRGVDVEELVAAAGDVTALTGTAAAGATIPEDQLAEIFGIALETGPGPVAPRKRRRRARPSTGSGRAASSKSKRRR
ncbi:MAG TPA: SWIM zinc finger family protein, partial [Anaeromyxobacteraceae bacterium]|nr:SWIM zinc finger family protein [Anaeromyxobacteraceae bacterium]